MCNPIADDNCPLDQTSIIIITCLSVGTVLMCVCACVCNVCLGNHPCHGFGKGVRRRRRYSYSVSYSGGGGGYDCETGGGDVDYGGDDDGGDDGGGDNGGVHVTP